MSSDSVFGAFISHSHADGAFAIWLRDELETFRMPSFDGTPERRVGKVFLDRDELPAGGILTTALVNALQQSAALIVVCSPAAAASRYVATEILEYRRHAPDRPIFPVILAGEATDGVGVDDGDIECFPEPLRTSQGGEELLAADFRKGKDGPHRAKLKLLAGLLQVELGTLLRREVDRQVLRMVAVAGAEVAAGRPEEGVSVALRARSGVHAGTPIDIAEKVDAALFKGMTAMRAQQRFAGHTAPVLSAAFSADGCRIATASADGSVKVWDRATARLLQTLTLHSAAAAGVGFTSEGALLIAAQGRALRVYSQCQDGASYEICDVMEENSAGVLDMALASDRRHLACRCDDGQLRVWHIPSGRVVHRYGRPISGVCFSANGDTVLALLSDRRVVAWDLNEGRLRYLSQRHSRDVSAVAFDANAGRLATGCEDGTICLWEVPQGSREASLHQRLARWLQGLVPSPELRVIRSLQGHSRAVCGLALAGSAENGWELISAGADNTVRWWDAGDGRALRVANGHREPETGPTAAELFASLSPSSPTNMAEVRPAPRGEALHSRFAMHPRGWHVAAAHDGIINLWSVPASAEDDGTSLPALHVMGGKADSIVFSDDGHHLLAASGGGAEVWYARWGADLVRECRVGSSVSRLSALSEVVLLLSSQSVAVVDRAFGRTVFELKAIEGAEFRCAAVNGRRLATADSERRVVIWDIDTGKPVAELERLPTRFGLSPFLAFALHDEHEGAANRQLLKDAYPDLAAWYDALPGDGGPVPWPSIPPSLLPDFEGKAPPKSVFMERSLALQHLAFSADGNHLLAVDDEGFVSAWLSAGGSRHDAMLALDSDARKVVVEIAGSARASFQVVDALPHTALRALRHPSIPKPEAGYELVSPDGALLVVLDSIAGTTASEVQRSRLSVWNNLLGTLCATRVVDEDLTLVGVSSSCERLIASRTRGGAWILNTADLATVAQIEHFYNPCGFSNRYELSSDGRMLLVSNPRTVIARLFSTLSGGELAALSHPWEIGECCLSADSQYLVTTNSTGRTVWLWHSLPRSSSLQQRADAIQCAPLPQRLQQECTLEHLR